MDVLRWRYESILNALSVLVLFPLLLFRVGKSLVALAKAEIASPILNVDVRHLFLTAHAFVGLISDGTSS